MLHVLSEQDIEVAVASAMNLREALSRPAKAEQPARKGLKQMSDLLEAILDGANTENHEAVLLKARRVRRELVGGEVVKIFDREFSGVVEL